MDTVDDLPRAHVKRIVKAKLAELQVQTPGDSGKREIQVSKEVLAAMAESAKIFIHYLTATANDACRDSKRSTISADDVLRAVEDIEFADFVPPLQASLEGFKKEAAQKKAAAGKRKAKDISTLAAEEGDAAAEDEDEVVPEVAAEEDLGGDDERFLFLSRRLRCFTGCCPSGKNRDCPLLSTFLCG